MVRENRIKSKVVYATTAVTGSLIANTYAEPINGEILKFRVEGIASPGSVWVGESGTNIEIYRNNSLTSGLSAYEAYPFVYGVDPSNTTGSPQAYYNRVTENSLYIAASGLTSGTGVTLGPVTVFYR